MRISVSGSHATGKSTLVTELSRRVRSFTVIDEPYYLLEEEGHAFGDRPTTDDFTLLLERSVSLVNQSQSRDVLFDRSPADYLAYLVALGGGSVSQGHVLDVTAAIATLDLLVFVPIERPDRIETTEAPRLRRRVDQVLRDMFLEGNWAFDVPVVVARGTLTQRVDRVMARLVNERGY